MEAWIYLAIAGAATAVPAVGLSLLVHTDLDRSEGHQPRWVRAKSALVAAVGGAAAVVRIGRQHAAQKPAARDAPGTETE